MRVYPGKQEWLVIGASAWMALTCNTSFWAVFLGSVASGPFMPFHVASFVVLTLGILALVSLLLTVGYALRPVLALLLLTAAAVGYFSWHYGMQFDENMLVNVLQTDTAEASELMTPGAVFWIAALGILPAVWVFRVRLPSRQVSHAVTQRAAALLVSAALIAVPLLVDQREIVSVVRNHRELGHLIAPVNAVVSSVKYVRHRHESTMPYRPLAVDAHRNASRGDGRPAVHVLLLGETARAANFSLIGYERVTNPELGSMPLYARGEISSCGTSTAESLPCMFSLQTQDEYDRVASRHQDGLLDIAERAGYKVLWIENGNNCKGVCSHSGLLDLARRGDAELCDGHRCYDEILVRELRHTLANVKQDTLIVLHTLGSHGPSYYRRYPDRFRRFTPDCRSDDLGQCTREEVVNSYDNTILYTDHVVAEVIHALEEAGDRLATSLVYVSDHGESLGEHQLYLHGVPRSVAPQEQTRVPMLAWISDAVKDRQRLAASCDAFGRPASHDNLIHTELGILGISTDAYDRELDVFGSCRGVLAMSAALGAAVAH